VARRAMETARKAALLGAVMVVALVVFSLT
jgi:hypothetical protein